MTAGLSRTEVTRFPHAVLDVRLKFPATHTLPSWLQVSFPPLSSSHCVCQGTEATIKAWFAASLYALLILVGCCSDACTLEHEPPSPLQKR